MSRPKLATVWLDGCSGCHMSLLDVDERLLQVVELADLVYSPLVDNKIYPDDVDVVLVEGAVSTDEDLARIKMVRSHSRIVVAFGDCAVTTNVPGMRNSLAGLAGEPLYQRAYVDNVTFIPGVPSVMPTVRLPRHLPKTLAVHKVVDVDVFLPGCPPSADIIFDTLVALLEGRAPEAANRARFGK
jgi:NAD-reducing hydrogenase small subunit